MSHPIAGRVYRHWKGTEYRCLAVATHAISCDLFVVYRSAKFHMIDSFERAVVARHTEKDETLVVYGAAMILCRPLDVYPLAGAAVMSTANEGPVVWCRPLAMWRNKAYVGVPGDLNYAEVPRFQLVEEERS